MDELSPNSLLKYDDIKKCLILSSNAITKKKNSHIESPMIDFKGPGNGYPNISKSLK